MGRIGDTVVSYLQNDNWNFERINNSENLKCGVKGKNASYRIFFSIKEENNRLVVYVVSPFNIPEEKRVAAAEFIARANSGMYFGNLELDLDDGEVRYKTSIDLEGGTLTEKMVENLIYWGYWGMDRYYPGLMALIYGGKSPAEAVKDCDNV